MAFAHTDVAISSHSNWVAQIRLGKKQLLISYGTFYNKANDSTHIIVDITKQKRRSKTDLPRIDSLPDYMEKESLLEWFNTVLDYASDDDKLERVEEITDVLYELSLRQWHTYEQLDSGIKYRIAK